MKTVANFVLAVVVAAILFVAPVGACANSKQTNSKPCHPCCPRKSAPLPADCARPGCVYLGSRVIPASATADSQIQHVASVPLLEARRPYLTRRSTPLAVPNFLKPSIQTYLVCCQFLI